MSDASLKEEEKEEERARGERMAGSLRMVEERIVSDRVERRKSFEDSFLLFTDRPGSVGDGAMATMAARGEGGVGRPR